MSYVMVGGASASRGEEQIFLEDPAQYTTAGSLIAGTYVTKCFFEKNCLLSFRYLAQKSI